MSGAMPPDLAEIHDLLYQEVSWLHARWNLYCQLYASSEDTVDLLNRSASVFFGICQDVLIDSALLGISRLTDPEETRLGKEKKPNLSLRQLLTTVDAVAYPTLRDDIKQAIDATQGDFEFARDLRNRRIAHNDLSVHRKNPVTPLAKANHQKIETALENIRNIMNLVEEHVTGSTTGYSMIVLPGDGDALIACLRDAESYREQHQRRRRQPITE
jgi:hypothetical protein